MVDHRPLPADSLRWRCDRSWLHFESTDEVPPTLEVVGQDDAIESLRFGLAIRAPGQNVFVRGLEGTGRLTLLRSMLETTKLRCGELQDQCYIHNFENPDQPRLLTLPAGTARKFQRSVEEFLRFVGHDLVQSLDGEHFRSRRDALTARLRAKTTELAAPFEEQLKSQGLALVTLQVGEMAQPAIVPVVDGAPVSADGLRDLLTSGALTESDHDRIVENISKQQPALEDLSANIDRLHEEHQSQIRTLLQTEVRALLARRARRIAREHPSDQARDFLDAVVEDVVEHRLADLSSSDEPTFLRLYRVNVVVGHAEEARCPVIAESNPTLENLVGHIDPEISADLGANVDHNCIRAGSLMRANGGYLLVEARELLQEPGGWRALIRTLRSGQIEFLRPDQPSSPFSAILKPQPAPTDVKVILVGDTGLYYALEEADPDFSTQFKVIVDFDSTIPANAEGAALYAGVLSKIAHQEGLLPITADGVAALVEHGARIAERNDRLTTRFGRLADIAREGDFLARRNGQLRVDGEIVGRAVRDMKRRADLPSRHFRRAITEGAVRIDTSGSVVGQINGLAVVHAGPLTYGFPARITATIGPGSAGAINIEREAQLSGAIHTKGFYILSGQLRYLLRTPHPLAFSASLAFEQSYGGIDGDSASGAEMCCLLSALTQAPLRQDLAMTGSVDQHGHVQVIGAVNEKIEGFFDTCLDVGITGTQGVVIPQANAHDLMLRTDVVDACRRGEFHVYAVDRIHEALELFTSIPAGDWDAEGNYPEGSLLRRAVDRAREYWESASRVRLKNQ